MARGSGELKLQLRFDQRHLKLQSLGLQAQPQTESNQKHCSQTQQSDGRLRLSTYFLVSRSNIRRSASTLPSHFPLSLSRTAPSAFAC